MKTKTKKKVAVFGGTGFVGHYLTEALIDAGYQPCLLVRSGSDDKVSRPALCRITFGSIDSDQAISDTLSDCVAVIYNIGILKEDRRSGITFEELQYHAVTRVADIALSNGVTRFLLMSANGVKQPGTTYQETKLLAENYVRGVGLRTTILRPSIIFGDPHGRLEITTQLRSDLIDPPVPAVCFFTGWRPSRGAILMSPVHVDDIAQSFIAAINDDSTIDGIYELGGPDILTWCEIVNRVAAASGRRKRVFRIPVSLMRLAATLLDWLPNFPVTRDQLTMLAEGNVADPGALEKLIKRQPSSFDIYHLAYLGN